ncbi:MAG: PAS domain S-box protein [Leptolyngbya sp.]|nr:PAS domain S-box protein [Leptolyngbya sp.]
MSSPIQSSSAPDASLSWLSQPVIVTPETPLLTVMARLGGRASLGEISDIPNDGSPSPADGADCVVVAKRGRLEGVLTLGDVGRLLTQRQPLEGLTVGQVMSQPVMSLPQSLLNQPWAILDWLHHHHICHLPMVDDQGRLVGVLTKADLIRRLGPIGLYYSPSQGASAPPSPSATAPFPTAAVPLATLARSVPATLYVLEKDALGSIRLPYLGPQVEDLYGVSALAMGQDGQRFVETIHPADQAEYWAALETSAATQQPLCHEYRIVTPAGQEKWIRAHGQPETLPQGGVRWFGVMLEITNRKRAEQDRILASRRLQEAQRIAQIGHWEMDLWTNTLHWSEEIFHIFEIDPQKFEASYEAFLEAIHPEDRGAVHDAYSRHLWDRQPYKITHRLLFPDGRIKYVQEQCETLYNPNGSPYLSQGTVQDVTELKQTEMALAELNADLERRVAQRTLALHQSETRYRQIVETASEGVWILDAEARHVLANPTLLALLGQTAETMAGTSWLDYVEADFHPQVEALIQRCQAGQAEQDEMPLRRRDGSTIWVLMSISPVVNEQQQYDGLLAMVTNITERRLAENAIHQENTFRRLILDNLTEGICVCQACLGFPFVHFSVWNPQMEVITGYSQHEINHLGWYQSLYPDTDTRQSAIDRMEEMRRGDHLKAEEWEIRHRDGSFRIVAITTTLLVDAQGGNNVLAVIQDITERKQAEQHIQQQMRQEALLWEITQNIRQSLDLQVIFDTACQEIRQVFQADRVGIFRFDPDSGYNDGMFVAESVAAGFSSVLAIPVHDHCFGEQHASNYIQGQYCAIDDISVLQDCHQAILAKFQVKANLVMPLICGDQLWGLLCIHQCRHRRHWGSANVGLGQQLAAQLAIAIQQATLYDQLQRELVDRQQAQAQLTQANQELAESNQELARATRLKDEFLANMSHELRTPLNAIMGMTEGMQEEVFGPVTPSQVKSLQTVEHSAAHLLSLINDILDVAKIESGQIELDRSSVPVAPLCSSTLAFVKQQALKKQIHLETHIPSPLPNLWVDERRVRQALLNLLTNAVKFTPSQGRISLTVTLLAASEADPDRGAVPAAAPAPMPPAPDAPAITSGSTAFLRFAVTDTGIGISPENIQRLFRPFVQIDSALNRQYAGTGLGLTLVKQIADLHGGRVNLTSELGIGSCFSIDLPCDTFSLSNLALTEPGSPPAVHRPAPASDPATSPVILLAEDNEANISTISSYLQAKGYTLRLAADGQQAIDQAQATPPDLILMDIQMPHVDGFTAIDHIRRMPTLTHVPIIALSALTMINDEERCLAAGADAYMAKPVRLNQLATLIYKLLHPQTSD